MDTTKITQVYGLTPDQLVAKLATSIHHFLSSQDSPKEEKVLEDEKLLTRQEASQYLKISLATLNNWSKSGLIKKCKIGNLVRFKEKELQKFIDNN
ncbi:MAG: helix-turn-helix domain-containing protein [Flavobacteriales bacterium]|jgi:excisionase family DNA binding protein|uniref:helix-turn-helix domain-containing protein n=1 Tax=Candidatus Ulvibacter alkanivorans TaxID=2267620 RepID=UPI000DF4A6BE|nr:helix-turn-helix domain-containing protein [Candidatus Ulvibacter alkanivorans]MCH2489281.1 helix-turn-helix domain-containing protein [Flavobacteriales bacterium]